MMPLAATAFATFLAALALVDAGVDAAVWHVPLQRHISSRNGAAVQGTHHRALGDSQYPWGMRLPSVDSSTGKHSSVWGRVFPVEHQSVAAVEEAAFFDIGHGVWAAQIPVGSPPQLVSLVLDIASSDVIVLNHAVDKHGFYDHNKSTTYHANGTQVTFYKDTPFEMSGFVSSDLVAMTSGDESARMSLVELVGPDRMLKGLMPGCDGSIGLGPHRSQATGAPSFIRSMINQGQFDAPIVGFHFDDHGAHATLGGIDESFVAGNITYFPETRMKSFGWWARVSGVRVDGEQVIKKGGDAMLFEGMDLIGGPREQVNALADAVDAPNYVLPCDGPGPDIIIQLGTLNVTLSKKDYAIPAGQGICTFAILPWDHDEWLLGMAFLRQVYTVLDYGSSENQERLGFAPLKKA